MPAVARAIARHLEGRLGLVRSILFEVSASSDEAATARELAMQAFAGTIILHLVLRPLGEEQLAFDPPVEDSVIQLAELSLAGMRADEPPQEACT